MKLIKNNQSFTCKTCGKQVDKAVGVSRDHCPFCITSQHVDLEIPGDRLSNCGGSMPAVRIRNWKQDTYKVLFRCETCGKEQWNMTASDDSAEIIAQLMYKTNQSLLEN